MRRERHIVAQGEPGESLADKYYVSYVVRLVVARGGTRVTGELVGLDGASLGHFADWAALVHLLTEVVREP
jgi:hypothetical protein